MALSTTSSLGESISAINVALPIGRSELQVESESVLEQSESPHGSKSAMKAFVLPVFLTVFLLLSVRALSSYCRSRLEPFLTLPIGLSTRWFHGACSGCVV